MNRMIVANLRAGLLAMLTMVFLASSARGAATIVIQNVDFPGEGFNDSTPVAPVGNNPGTTLGQQRLNAFQFAANIYGAILNSNSTITIQASWRPLTCTATSGVLGSAGNFGSIWRDFPGAQFPGTWYGSALANALSGIDRDPANAEIRTQFNINLGTPGCLENTSFYLGLDNNHGTAINLVAVLLHEFTHGLGFQTFTSSSSGIQNSGFPSIYDRFLFDNATSKTWVQMTDAERQASATNGNLAWNGTRVTADLQSVLARPLLRVNQPPAIAQNYNVGTAGFGPRLSSPGVTAGVVQALDPSDAEGPSTTDGCSAFTNSAAVAGKIALIDRGDCLFVTKVKNAQNAGAVGVIIANNVSDPLVIQMGGSDPTITIPSLMVSQVDGNSIRNQLGVGVNATLLLDTSAPSGVDAQNRALMFAPNPVQSGSSVSHWDTAAFPNQLMEPNISGDLTHSIVPIWDLTFSLLRDVGWTGNPIGDNQFFVRQHYRDFLNREPDSSGLAFWNNEIVSCGLDPACNDVKHVNVSAAFYLSIEFQDTGYLVHRFYKASFGDAVGTSTIGAPHQFPVPAVRFQDFLPDTQQIGQGVRVGIGDWQQQLESNKQAFAAAFVQRPAFMAAYPTSLSPAVFVDMLFTNAGVTPSASDRQAAINEFSGAGDTSNLAARGRSLRRVAENSTFAHQDFNRAFVLMQYFGYLRRNPNDAPDPDHTGYEFWLNKLNQFNGDFVNAEMVKAFITSIEYRQRFGS